MKNPVMFIYNAFRKLLSVTLSVSTKNEFSIANYSPTDCFEQSSFLVSTII